MMAAWIGLALAETTGAFTGVNIRFSVVAGAALGLLAAVLADARETTTAKSRPAGYGWGSAKETAGASLRPSA